MILLMVLLFQSGSFLDPSPEEDVAHAATSLETQIRLLHAGSSVDRARAAQEIGRMGSYAAPAVPELLKLLGDNEQAKSWADRLATALYGMLNPLASSGASTVGEEAMMALVKIGASAVDGLINEAKHRNNDIRLRSIRALRLMQDPRAEDTFIAALYDENERIRYESLWGIADLKRDNSVTLIAPLLDEPGITIQTNTIHALAGIGGKEAFRAITNGLASRDMRYRITVCEVLGNMKNADPVPMLITLLQDTEWAVRMSAAQALGSRKDGRAVRPLIDALSDPNDTVRNQVGMALMLITGANHGSDKPQWEMWWKQKKDALPAGQDGLRSGKGNHSERSTHDTSL